MPEGLLLLNSQLSSNDVKQIRAALKAAYWRGREDAAKAVEWWLIEELGQGCEYEAAMAAARGDSEQA